MAREANSTCAICGRPYHCCSDSMSAKSITPWKRIVDTPEHYKVFITLQSYTNNRITKEEAAGDLKNCDLGDKGTYKEDIQKAIDLILDAGGPKRNDRPPKARKSAAGINE